MVIYMGSPSWDEMEEKYFDSDLAGDEALDEQVAKGDKGAFKTFVHNKQTQALKKQKEKGINTGDVRKYGVVKKSYKMFPKAQENALKRRGLTQVKALAEKKGIEWSPRLKINEGMRIRKGYTRKSRAVYVYDPQTKQRSWAFKDRKMRGK